MDKLDLYENYSSQENKTFNNEYKNFPAEDYYVKENILFKKEIIDVDETFIEGKKTIPKNKEKDDTLKRINELSNSSVKSLSTSIASTTSSIIASTSIIVMGTIIGAVPGINMFKESPKMEIVEESLIDVSGPNEIKVEGKIENLKNGYSYYASVDQYFEKELLSYDELVELQINDNNGAFEFSVPAYFGTTSYQYEIYYSNDDNPKELFVSKEIEFDQDQSYDATYDKVLPNEAKIIYNDDGSYNIKINTNFETKFKDAFAFKLNILSEDGAICGEYEGTDKNIDINMTYQGNIYFEYIDIGYFSSGIHEYERLMVDGKLLVGNPNFQLLNEVIFRGSYYAIPYQISTFYDLSTMNLSLELIKNGEMIIKNVENLSMNGEIVLDEYSGEIDELKIKGTLYFNDDTMSDSVYQININEKIYQLKYKFNIKEVRADVFSESNPYIPVTFKFDYFMPETYLLNIKCEDLQIDEKISITNEYTISSLDSNNGGIISVSVIDDKSIIFIEEKLFTINTRNQILDGFVQNNSFLSVNPYESVVTYNEDGTINIYRDVNFSTEDARNYYDAALFCNVIDGEEEKVLEYHNISNEKYSIIENLPANDYYFKYYMVMKFNDVYYYTWEEMPSGSVLCSNTINATGEYDVTTNKTTINIISSLYGEFENYCLIDDNIYTFENYVNSSTDQTLKVVGNLIGNSVKCYFAQYSTNYDNYVEKMDIKGNKYKLYDMIIEEKAYE